MEEKKEKIEMPPPPKKGRERKRKERLVIKRKELREKEERKREREERRKEKEERKKEKGEREVRFAEPLIYVQIHESGRRYETHSTVKMERRKPWRKPNPEEICSTIPGSVVLLFVKEGDSVEKDQQIMEYEAMKMCNVIRAPFSGVVLQILVNVGDKLPRGVPMVVIRSTETAETEIVHGTLSFEEYA